MPISENTFQLAFDFLQQEPRAAARLLENQPAQEVSAFLVNSKVSLVVRLLHEMNEDFCGRVLLESPKTELALWLADTPNNVVAAICRRLNAEQQNSILAALSSKKNGACRLLLDYHPDMIGAWMETDVPVFPGDMSVEEVLSRLKKYSFKESRLVFVIDHSRQLLGKVSPLELVRSSKIMDLATLAQPCETSLSGRSQIAAIIRHPVWRQQDYAPIVNRQKEFLGVIWHSQLRELLQHKMRAPHLKQSADAVFDIFYAHGESMRALLDVLGGGLR